MPEDPTDSELAEFTSDSEEPVADPAFRERLRAELWDLLTKLLADREPER